MGYNGLTFSYSQHDHVSSEWMNAERATEEEFEAAKAEFIRLMNGNTRLKSAQNHSG